MHKKLKSQSPTAFVIGIVLLVAVGVLALSLYFADYQRAQLVAVAPVQEVAEEEPYEMCEGEFRKSCHGVGFACQYSCDCSSFTHFFGKFCSSKDLGNRDGHEEMAPYCEDMCKAFHKRHSELEIPEGVSNVRVACKRAS